MLSKRLNAIANLVPQNKVVYDVGSDHGLLPCFLVSSGKCKKAYASDNKSGPLNKAISNIETMKLSGKVIPVLADGIELIANDAEVITITGMGFFTVKHILDDKDLSKYEEIIVQVNKDSELLRKWINDHHYRILDETIVEDDFYYEIVVFDSRIGEEYSALECKYGPINLKKKDPVFIEYLKDKKEKLIKVNKKAKKEEYAQEIYQIEQLLKGEQNG